MRLEVAENWWFSQLILVYNPILVPFVLLYPSIVFNFIFDQHSLYHFDNFEIFEKKSSSSQKDVFKFFSIQNCRTLQIKNRSVMVSFAIPNTLRRRKWLKIFVKTCTKHTQIEHKCTFWFGLLFDINSFTLSEWHLFKDRREDFRSCSLSSLFLLSAFSKSTLNSSKLSCPSPSVSNFPIRPATSSLDSFLVSFPRSLAVM